MTKQLTFIKYSKAVQDGIGRKLTEKEVSSLMNNFYLKGIPVEMACEKFNE